MSAVLEAREPIARYLEAIQPALTSHFDLLAKAPGGVARLRRLILDLAVQGKLSPQDPNEESASGLVRRIRSYRDEQVKTGLAKRERPFTPLIEANLPFQLPAGWEWIRFDELIEPAKPISYGVLVPGPEISGGVPFVRIADLSLTDPPAKPEKSISMEVDAQYQRTRLEGGEILMGVVGSIGKLGVAPPTWAGANIARAICRIVPVGLVDHGFVLLLLQSEFMRASFAGDTRTLAQPTLNVGLIRSSATPLPPLAEQARIVARVDELMRLCDALEAKGQLEAEQHARLVCTLLGTLTDSSTPEELAANWQRVADHFDLLLDRPEAVDALEQTILQLAVRGLLVPRGHWNRSRFGDVVAMLNGYAFKSEWFMPSGIRLVRNVNVSHGRLDWHRTACVSTAVAEEFSQFELAEGDVVLTLDRPIISTGLKVAVVEAHDLPCLLLQRVARLSPHANVLTLDFMLLWLLSDSFMKAIDPGRSNGVPHISTKQVAALTIDLPPMAEQARIVARVTELRRLCADLRQRLSASRTTQSHLAEALVESAAA